MSRTRSRPPAVLPDPASLPRPWVASYPPGVPPGYRFPDVPVTRFLDDAARDFPEQVALDHRGWTCTWAELRDRVDRFASALLDLGVTAGDHLGVALPNLPAWVVASFAAWRVGAVLVPLEPGLGVDDLVDACEHLEVRVLVCLEPHVPTVNAARARLPGLAHVVATGVQDWLPVRGRMLAPLAGRRAGWYRRVRPDDDVWSLTGLVEHAGGLVKQVPLASDAPAAVLRTGGTTGRRRAVVLTHRNLVANTFQARLWVPDVQAGRETLLCALPLWHAYGLTMGMLVAVLAGARLVLVARPDVDEVLDAVDRTRPTLLPGVPRLYAALVDHPHLADHDLSSIRACVSGGAPLPPEVHRAFEAATGGARLREGYGLTECAPLTHANPIYGRTTPGAIGLPVTDTVATVVDPTDLSRRCEPGEVGMLVVHGPQVMAGYWRDPEATAEVLRDGWLVTGDLATHDEDGVFRIVERAGEVLDVEGTVVVPSVVEGALLAHPGVLEAALVGLPDDEGRTRLTAFVVLRARSRATAGELTEHCRQRLDDPAVVPHEVRVVEELPRSVLGKVLRRELERRERARLQTVAGAAPEGRGGPT